MIKIIAGKYGPKLLGPDTKLELSQEEEKRLVERKIAIYISENRNEEESEEMDYLSEEEIKKMKSKQELIDYAVSIGMEGLNTDMKKEELVNEIENFIDELLEESKKKGAQ